MYRCVPILLYLQNQAPLIYTMSIILGLLQLNLSSNTDTRQWLWSSFVIGVCFCLCNPATSKPFYFVLKSILYSDPWYLGIFFYWSIVALQCCIVSAAAAKSFQLCPTLCDPIDSSPTRLPCPRDSPGTNTGVGCHFLLQCMKAKSEIEVARSCPTLSDPMDCSPPGSSIHGIFQARVLEWGAIDFSEWYSEPLQTHLPDLTIINTWLLLFPLYLPPTTLTGIF